ncbi:lasso peptide biosynthesis PqqD family chaperone [Brevibacterium sp. HMSC07C04]|uniref:lasso peptide biosynthesis PqqD family chaperone n=1 Tax=Brevibacterium sp. HMSC07C04 TaxID=1581130 RepID=UPI0008A54356|nr:lasso peptide biosynthesis PqqD family chaperone [Brevibacterium sp. HMSC07C04]OFS26526.1 hypothetical protein HMPREF3162_05130 [Brevibacterium sp. HMSC07C04]
MPRKNDSSPKVHVVDTEYGQVLLNEADGAYLHLNATAALIKSRLDAGDDTDAIVRALVDEYDVDADTARRDVEAFCRALDEKGLR